MSIRDEWIILDTNVWIFGLRRIPDFPACAELLEYLNRLRVVLARQILQESQANLVDDELRILFRLLNRLPIPPKVDWQKAAPETVAKYRRKYASWVMQSCQRTRKNWVLRFSLRKIGIFWKN